MEPWTIVATTHDEQRSAELELVLAARGFAHQRFWNAHGWQLAVPAERADAAIAELVAYRRENARATGPARLAELGHGWPGVGAYCLVLLVVFVCMRRSTFALDWYGAGRLVAGRVVDGEWWRTVTALTMHVEVDHLGGNLVFGAFFGYFAGRYLGGGLAWLSIVIAGSFGNVLNALVQAPDHRSIGASTAVFAALGLLTAFTWRRGFLKDTPWRTRVGPIVAGIALLAFTGAGGENTDVFAHLTGFVSGFGAGLVIARFAPPAIARRRRVQRACSIAAALIVSAAWAWGLASAG